MDSLLPESRGWRRKGKVYRVKGVKYMVAEGNWTLDGKYTIEYRDVKL